MINYLFLLLKLDFNQTVFSKIVKKVQFLTVSTSISSGSTSGSVKYFLKLDARRYYPY